MCVSYLQDCHLPAEPEQEDGYRRYQFQRFRDARKPGQRRERIVERRRILLGNVRRDGYVVGNRHEVKAQLLRETRPVGK